MEYLKIIRDTAWGCEIIYLPLKEIRAILYAQGPSHFTIYFLDKMICGFLTEDFDLNDLQWKIRHNEYCYVHVYEELPIKNDENTSDS
jgi:hypothetical protein